MCKLDRLARSVIKGTDIIETLFSKGITVEILNIGRLDKTIMGKLMRTVLLAFAEFERDSIVERTADGRAIARTKVGFSEGRPRKYKPKQIEHALELLESNTHSRVSTLTGISVSTLRRELRSRKHQEK